MQAENAAEREKSKKNRQYATPPARSKASGLGIAKKFLDFLLEHSAPSLRPPAQASYLKDICMTLLQTLSFRMHGP
jgi:hypothetical protein